MTTSPLTNEEISEKIHEFGEILQKFGLQLIQSIGEMKHTISILSDKVDTMSSELLNLKALNTSIQKQSTTERLILDKISELSAKIEGFAHSDFTKKSENEEAPMLSMDNPLEILHYLSTETPKIEDINVLKRLLEEAKERLYVLSGGHKILFELNSVLRQLKNNHQQGDLDKFKSDIVNKLQKWMSEFI